MLEPEMSSYLFLGNLILFLGTFWGNYLRSNTGFSVGFTGPDGSGKTTVIDLLLDRLAPVFRTAYKYYHFRPALFGNLGEVAHSAGLKKRWIVIIANHTVEKKQEY